LKKNKKIFALKKGKVDTLNQYPSHLIKHRKGHCLFEAPASSEKVHK